MKKLIPYRSLLIIGCLLLNACIDDDSKDAYIPLSQITFQVEKDTLYTDYGNPTEIAVKISQSITGKELQYEWRAAHVNHSEGEGRQEDSLKFISTEPVFHHVFNQLGEFRVRLRISNGDLNEMHNFRVFVQTPFNQGLLVLSKDEQGRGRTSFLRAQAEEDIVLGTGYEFMTHAVELINPDYPLDDVSDMAVTNQYLFITLRESQQLYMIDKLTFDIIFVYDLKKDVPWMYPAALATRVVPYGLVPTEFYLLSENGDFCVFDTDKMFAYEDKEIFPQQAVYERCYSVSGSSGYYYFIDNIHARIDYFSAFMTMKFPFNSGDYFEGYHINNLVVGNDIGLWTTATDKQDASSVRITKFKNMSGLGNPFDEESSLTYQSAVMTLTDQSHMIMNSLYNLCFYNRGADLYQWKYMEGVNIQPLPERPVKSVNGEITCMSMSADQTYLYLGVWESASPQALKGSVLVYDIEKREIIKTYPNIADKPVQLFYKNK